MGWWSEIGIDVDDQTVPQNDFINLAVFGVPEFQVFPWRQHAGVFVDQQYLWWHSDERLPRRRAVAELRPPARSRHRRRPRRRPPSTTDEEAIAAAEEINRIFAEQCYYIPLNWLPWAVLSNPTGPRLGRVGAA